MLIKLEKLAYLLLDFVFSKNCPLSIMMECKFLEHGLAIGYNQIVKPCCAWTADENYNKSFNTSKINIQKFHKLKEISDARNQLANNEWPDSCAACRDIEQQGRQDSMRYNAEQAYAEFSDGDITLELRPGNTCNFACQTCWPAASSRVKQYYIKLNLIKDTDINENITNFEYLLELNDRIKTIILLGGEPFYDKNCLRFLKFAETNLTANIIMFTNGSCIDYDFIKNYKGTITLVFSLDAVGESAEYVRNGTVWQEVLNNYLQCKKYNNVEQRVNITTSSYNYHLLEKLIDFLIEDWPSVVSFGVAQQKEMGEKSIPLEHREQIVISLNRIVKKLSNSSIEEGQRHNAINAIASISNNLRNQPFDKELFNSWKSLTQSLDQLKNQKPDEFLSMMLSVEVN